MIHIASEGFESVSVEPAVGKPDDPFAVREEDLPQVKAEYDKLARYLLDHPEVNFFHFNVDLAQGPCVIKRMRGCGAGCEYVCITPDGDIYPCHQFVGNEEFKLGNVYDDTFDMELSCPVCRYEHLYPQGVRKLLGEILLLRRLLLRPTTIPTAT